MNLDIINTHNLGALTLLISSLIGGYYLLLQIKEFYAEKPDPKVTYAKISDLTNLKTHLNTSIKDNKSDLLHLRLEFKNDLNNHSKVFHKTIKQIQSLVQRNAQHIASLIAQCQSNNQRITEINIKTDKLIEKK